jgi:hypothetical protein
VKDVGEPYSGEPNVRFEAAAGGNQRQSAMLRGARRLPPTLQIYLHVVRHPTQGFFLIDT